MYDLTQFTLKNMTECGATLREQGRGATSMEDVANRVVHYFYDNFRDSQTGEPAFALVRFFKTHLYGALPSSDLQDFARTLAGDRPLTDATPCLTLLATVGSEPEWNSRQASSHHQAIPLLNEQLVAQSPMISQLIQQFGLKISDVVHPDPDLLIDIAQRTFNVFYVPEANGSKFIPAQAEFVIPHQIKSVLGFGGVVPSGNFFAVILFSKVFIPRNTAGLFKTLALNVKLAALPHESLTFRPNSAVGMV